MPKIALSQQLVKSTTCPLGKAKWDLFDSNCKGLMLETRASGGKRRLLDEIEYADASDREIAQLCGVSHPFVARIRADMQNPACRSESAPIVKSSKWTRDRTKEVETLPPPVFEDSYDQDREVMQEMAQELEVLTDRLSLKAMDATDEEKAMAAETIQSLRDEVKKLTFNLEAMTKSRDQYQNQAAEAIRQCERYKHVMKKLNRQISQLQAKLDMPPTQDETVPF